MFDTLNNTIHIYENLTAGTLIRRYKRFLADVKTVGGETVTAFCPNTGSMRSCSEPGSLVMLSKHNKPERKTKYTLEMVRSNETWVGVNTLLTNDLAARIIKDGHLDDLFWRDLEIVRRETVHEDSRLDFLLTHKEKPVYMEVKSVTLRMGNRAQFPDSVTVRGKKHMNTLAKLARQGIGAAVLFLVQRSDCASFSPADDIDPAYTISLIEALGSGVKSAACMLDVNPERIEFMGSIPINI